jgi:hypothetical protein
MATFAEQFADVDRYVMIDVEGDHVRAQPLPGRTDLHSQVGWDEDLADPLRAGRAG